MRNSPKTHSNPKPTRSAVRRRIALKFALTILLTLILASLSLPPSLPFTAPFVAGGHVWHCLGNASGLYWKEIGRAHAQGATDFTDLRGHWAEPFVRSLYMGGILDIPEDGRFRPDEPVTRLDFTVWIAKSLELSKEEPGPTEEPPFKDMDSIPDEAKGYILAALKEGIITGYPDKTFRPLANINRAEMGVIFGRGLIKMGVTPEPRYFKTFADGDKIPSWAQDASAAIKQHIILGRPGKPLALYAPFDTTTRAEAVTMIERFLNARFELLPWIPKPPVRPMPKGKLAVVYYANTDDAYQSLVSNGDHIDMVIYTSYFIGQDGNLYGYDSPRTLKWGQDHDKPVIAMFGNHNLDLNHKILSDEQVQSQAIQSIKNLMARGYSGINLDFEWVPAGDRELFSRFVARLVAELKPEGYLVTLSLPAKTKENLTSNWVGAFDYQRLGQLADYIAIMTYDQHWKGGPPGPIGDLAWMESVMNYALTNIPPSKLLLGIPAYGYDWPLVAGQNARALTARNAENLARQMGKTPVLDPSSGESWFEYTDSQGIKRKVYYNTAKSMEYKLELVHKLNLAGMAMWRLGYETPDFWRSIPMTLRR
ncbi:MAG TPA: hypothetical protein GX507_04225 [Clostridia bacterium]|nr:hypothetical protein [Clostridia bacterium]